MPWKNCQTCHGQKTILVETKPGVWERRTCPACGGAGGVHTETI